MHHPNIKAWLSVTTKNNALNKVKSSWKKKVTLMDAPINIIADTIVTIITTNLLNNLPIIYLKYICLYYYAGYNTEEIAELTCIKPSTVRSRLKRGREYLKDEIENEQGCENYEY